MTGINWNKLQDETKARAKEFMGAEESDRIWYIGGEIVDAAMVCNAWDDNILEVCKWQVENGRGLQPKMANSLMYRNLV